MAESSVLADLGTFQNHITGSLKFEFAPLENDVPLFLRETEALPR